MPFPLIFLEKLNTKFWYFLLLKTRSQTYREGGLWYTDLAERNNRHETGEKNCKFLTQFTHSPTNALFINLVKSFKFTLKYTKISLLHVLVFNDYHQGDLSVPN